MSRRDRMLDALAIGPQWVRRGSTASPPHPASPQQVAPDVAPVIATAIVPAIGTDLPALAGNGGTVSSSPLYSMPAPAVTGIRREASPAVSDDAIAGMDWDALQAAIAGCTRCGLCAGRQRTVFGVGDPAARWLFVGEGPGREEDLQGLPFVGPAGKLLDNMLAAMGLRRGDNAFIANVVKCRPTDPSGKDRAPTLQEMAACMPYLERQIALIQPSIVVALGKTAGLALLKCDPATPVARMRGVVHRLGSLPLVVTYHPAYLLRMPTDKRKAWEDLCMAMDAHGG